MSGHSLTDAERGGERLGVEAGRERLSYLHLESLDGSSHMVIPASQAREQAHECLAVAEDGSASVGERSCSARAAIAYAILELASAIRETANPSPEKGPAVPASSPPNEVGTE